VSTWKMIERTHTRNTIVHKKSNHHPSVAAWGWCLSGDGENHAPEAYDQVHGFKPQILWLHIGLVGCVFVAKVQQNDNGEEAVPNEDRE
jgi:hypothetical protein